MREGQQNIMAYLDNDMHHAFKVSCVQRGWSMSRRLRFLVERDLEQYPPVVDPLSENFEEAEEERVLPAFYV